MTRRIVVNQLARYIAYTNRSHPLERWRLLWPGPNRKTAICTAYRVSIRHGTGGSSVSVYYIDGERRHGSILFFRGKRRRRLRWRATAHTAATVCKKTRGDVNQTPKCSLGVKINFYRRRLKALQSGGDQLEKSGGWTNTNTVTRREKFVCNMETIRVVGSS